MPFGGLGGFLCKCQIGLMCDLLEVPTWLLATSVALLNAQKGLC